MVDVVSRAKRSKMMSGIRGRNTKPELIIRSALHRQGFRFRLHYRQLPGKPDIVLPRYRVLILVNGCFWHGHDCHLFRWPSTRREFWREKISATKRRDQKNLEAYNRLGWRVLTVWECALKGRKDAEIDQVIEECVSWIRSGDVSGDIRASRRRNDSQATNSNPSL